MPMKFINILVYFLLLTLFSSFSSPRGLWLSNIPPAGEKKNIRPFGMHHLSSVRGKRGKVNIMQWICSGRSVKKVEYGLSEKSSDFRNLVFAPSGGVVPSVLDSVHGTLSYESIEEGFYNGYLVVKELRNDTLYICVAKAEMLNHQCRNGHKDVLSLLPPKTYPESIPIEIVRSRTRFEDFHYFVSSGDRIHFSIFTDRGPVQNAKVQLITETGWVNTGKTDSVGSITFQFIQDYFSSWKDLDTRKEYTYILYADKTVERQGDYNGKPYRFVHYQCSLSDAYRPSVTMYTSKVWAMILFVGIMVLASAGVFMYRMKTRRSLKDIVFDEKN